MRERIHVVIFENVSNSGIGRFLESEVLLVVDEVGVGSQLLDVDVELHQIQLPLLLELVLADGVHVLLDGLELFNSVVDRVHEHVVQELIVDVDVPGYHVQLAQNHRVQHLSLLLSELHVLQCFVVGEQGFEISSSFLELPVVHVLLVVDVGEVVRVVFDRLDEFLRLLQKGRDIFAAHSAVVVIQDSEEGSDSLGHDSWRYLVNNLLLENVPCLLVQPRLDQSFQGEYQVAFLLFDQVHDDILQVGDGEHQQGVVIEPLDGRVDVHGVSAGQHVGVEYNVVVLIEQRYFQDNVERVEMPGLGFDFLVGFFDLLGSRLEYLLSLRFLLKHFGPERLIVRVFPFLKNQLENIIYRLLSVVLNQQFVEILIGNLRRSNQMLML